MKNLVKKIFILLIIINLMIQIVSIRNVKALTNDMSEVTINISNKYATGGDTITVTIGVKGTQKGVTGLQGTLNYDKSVLEYVSKSMLKDGWRCTGYNNDTGVFLAEISSTSDTNSYITGTESVISFEFKVKNNATEGTTEFKVSNLVTVNGSLENRTVSEIITILSESENITYIDLNTTLNDLLNGTEETIELYNSKDEKITDSTTKIATGMKLKILNNTTLVNRYEIVVKGDISGDGQLTQSDLLRLVRYNAHLEDLDGSYLRATDINSDEIYGDGADISKMSRVLANMDKI